MAAIKAYTDISQSKKLAEILPLESADMYYILEDFVDEDTGDIFSIEKVSLGNHSNTEIGCWSLAALLDVLPAECECMLLEHINYGNNHKKYFMHYVGGENTEDYDNPVDACYEMIIKLNELKML